MADKYAQNRAAWRAAALERKNALRASAGLPPVPRRSAAPNDPIPVHRGEPVAWREPELPPAPSPAAHPLGDLDDAELDFLLDGFEAMRADLAFSEAERASFSSSGEAHRVAGIVAEGGDPSRIEITVIDWRERMEAEERNGKKG